ncbi:MAG: multidrug efflux system outer membrane protein [Rhodothermales bacterium]|jgi:multidrug efflux system outer membrane protein
MKPLILLLLTSSCTFVHNTSLAPKLVTHTQYFHKLPADEPEESAAAPRTLAECIELALAQSEAIGIAKERVKQAQFAEDAVVAAARPLVTLEGTHERSKDAGGSGSGGFGSFLEPTNDELKVRAETPLYSGFRNRSGRRAAQAWQANRMASLRHTRDKTALEVTEAYLSVLDADHQAATLRSQLTLQKAQITQMETRAAAGDARHSEVLLRQAQAAETTAALIAANEDEAVARETLAFRIGRQARGDLADPEIALPDMLTLSTLRDQALASRADLAALNSAILAREEDVETIRRGTHPEVTLAGEYFIKRGGILEDVDWLVSLELRWELADSGRRDAQLGEARSLIGEAILTHREQLRRVDLDLRRLLAEITGSQARTKALGQSLKLASSAHEQATAEYEAGVGQNLEVLAAEDQRLRAQLAISQQALRLQLLVAELRVATGQPPVPQ